MKWHEGSRFHENMKLLLVWGYEDAGSSRIPAMIYLLSGSWHQKDNIVSTPVTAKFECLFNLCGPHAIGAGLRMGLGVIHCAM
jgi:hypothetical protein